MRALVFLCMLVGCAPVSLPPAQPAQPAFDFRPYLAPAGSSETAPLGTGWLDYGGYQLVGHFWRPDGSAVASWLYAPFMGFDPAAEAGCPGSPCRGDGGERYVIDPDGTLRIDGTEDGGKAGVQYFVGKDCGGTGWVVAKPDIDASWRSMVAKLDDQPTPTSCTGSGGWAYTRYSLQAVTLPNLGTRKAVVSEHYDSWLPDSSMAMERLFLLDGGVGRVWQAWGKAPPTIDLTARCPDFGGWNTPPVAGWHLEDCRENVTPQPTTLTGGQFWDPR